MKTIIITGASGGIGAEIARTLDKEDNILILLYNKNFDKINKLQSELKCKNISFSCDLTNTQEIEKVIGNILESNPNIYALINCAGASIVKQIQDYTNDEITMLMSLNLTAPIILTKLASRSMISNKLG